jgi:hypothetical protein
VSDLSSVRIHVPLWFALTTEKVPPVRLPDTNDKPDCPLLGRMGTIWDFVRLAQDRLRADGQPERAERLFTQVVQLEYWEEALVEIQHFVVIT